MTSLRAKALGPQALERHADWLAVSVAVSLPWSTTATGILVVLWLVAFLPTLDVAAVRREVMSPAGGLPVALWLLAIAGLCWGDVSWRERLGGLDGFHRLLVIPLLLAQFRRSANGMRVLFGFLLSTTGVLILSWLLAVFPSFPWRAKEYGVPVKDYILQSENFLMCAFVLLALALAAWRETRWRTAVAEVGLAVLFLADIAFVNTGRTALLVAPVLALLLGWREFRWKGLVGAALLGCLLGGVAATGSPYLKARLEKSLTEYEAFRKSDAPNSTSFHLEFLIKSVSFVEAAPIIGHGTGSIPQQFRRAAIGQTGAASAPSVNPHNQFLAVAIQLGLIGGAILLAMWAAHVLLFQGSGLTCWIGLIIVSENIVSSLFNSHLFDFTQGWIYVFGVGVAGGMVLRDRDGVRAAKPAVEYEADPITA
jgi:O-antigen ligase